MMVRTKCLKYHNKLEAQTMYTNVSVEHNSKRDKTNKSHNKSLKNMITSFKYPKTLIYHNSHVLNNEYMISIYTYSHNAGEAHLLLGWPYYVYIYTLHVHLTPYIPPLIICIDTGWRSWSTMGVDLHMGSDTMFGKIIFPHKMNTLSNHSHNYIKDQYIGVLHG
jgi:hypothetical protein